MPLSTREILRIMTFSAYDLQLIRMQMGLRLTANFRNKLKRELEEAKENDIDLGDEEEQEVKEDELSEAALKLIDELKASHRRLTDAVAKGHRARKPLPPKNEFKGDALISEFTELVLVDQYLTIERDERNQFAQLEDALEPMPIYQNFLKDQIGIGPAMAAVLVSYFDPYKAPRISNFWSYAGLDVATTKVFVTNCLESKTELHVDMAVGEPQPSDGMTVEELKAAGYVGLYNIVHRGRSRRAEHLIDRPYTKKDGTQGTRKSVTYNPWLKSRLLGALATSFLRTKNCPWRREYDNYRHRIMSDANRLKVDSTTYKKGYKAITETGEYTPKKKITGWGPDGKSYIYAENDRTVTDVSQMWPPLRIHRAAMRYMIKMFLIEFWKAWRTCEGLEVTPTYHEAILGHVHHGSAAA